MFKELTPAFRITLLFTLLTGLLYPGIVTVVSQGLFRDQANGSLIIKSGKALGSSLIGQNFTKPEYFHPRPSAAGSGYDGASSSGSNLGPTSQKLVDRVKGAAAQFRQENPDFNGPIPADALTTSGSGLDPHISPANAAAQLNRVAKVRGLDPAQVQGLANRFTEGRSLGFLGEPRLNVLLLNIALDEQFPTAH
jgi:K+-transporting ATPase ATPase C chain